MTSRCGPRLPPTLAGHGPGRNPPRRAGSADGVRFWTLPGWAAPNGRVALDNLAAAPYDLAVSDVRMPEMDDPTLDAAGVVVGDSR